MAESLAEVVVESVRVHMLSSQHVVLLKETERERYLPIWIGPWEANAIATRLQGVTPERPLTHDLFVATLVELGVRVRRVIISSLAEETFHATLELERDGRSYAIDARPSDALALAVRTGVHIYASTEVLDRAGVEPESSRRREARGLPRIRQLARRRPRGRASRRTELGRPPPGLGIAGRTVDAVGAGRFSPGSVRRAALPRGGRTTAGGAATRSRAPLGRRRSAWPRSATRRSSGSAARRPRRSGGPRSEA